MIVRPSIAFSGFSGSAKDVTARQVHGRSILSCRTWPTGMATPVQLVRRASLRQISKSFRTLTAEQMAAWNTLAKGVKSKTILGEAAEISGMNLYIKLNYNRVMAGYSIMADAPEALRAVPNVVYEAAWVTPTAVIIKGVEHEEQPFKLVVRMSGGQSNGVSKGWSKTVIISPGMEEDWGDADVTKLYLSTIGVQPALGEKVFLEMYWLNTSTGVTGLTVLDSITCITDEQAAIEGLTVRFRYNEDDLYEGKTSSVSDMDLDFSTGISAAYIDAVCTGSASEGYSSLYLNTVFPEVVRGPFYCIGRSTAADGSLRVQLCLVEVKQSKNYSQVAISTMAGNYGNPSHVFGVGIRYE